jgi:hypothetical protein
LIEVLTGGTDPVLYTPVTTAELLSYSEEALWGKAIAS